MKNSNSQRGEDYVYIYFVFYVLAMKNNLLSLGQLLCKGYSLKMELGYLIIFDVAKRTMLKALLSKNRTFIVEI